ncbi:flavodoxin reductase [Sphingobacterium sp. N143]|uniref:flavodoxin reductase n=1 Tax=Sphingobacterium sp. N143 TaxID=2746727 RepID=UPI002575518F|nr:flavodoxin reductase [Sphingobacterium sp. N143]MDM1294189.1 flavodoxin reductase [Sphingobacterium sp. N143]
MGQLIKVKSISHLTHDVLRIRLEKPQTLTFCPGQAADISINKLGWTDKLRAFTFTSLPGDDDLEFSIKTYPERQGVTNQLLSLVPGDELILHDVFGAIAYKGEGLFIAGGAGVTPFIAIFRQLDKEGKIGNNRLLFANKTSADIIEDAYFSKLLGDHFVNVLSEEELPGYEHGYITEKILRKYMDTQLPYIYLCGPDPMMDAIQSTLHALGVHESAIIREEF